MSDTSADIASASAQIARDDIKTLRREVEELKAKVELLYSIHKGPEPSKPNRTVTRLYPT